jgi:hypothetical protein
VESIQKVFGKEIKVKAGDGQVRRWGDADAVEPAHPGGFEYAAM